MTTFITVHATVPVDLINAYNKMSQSFKAVAEKPEAWEAVCALVEAQTPEARAALSTLAKNVSVLAEQTPKTYVFLETVVPKIWTELLELNSAAPTLLWNILNTAISQAVLEIVKKPAVVSALSNLVGGGAENQAPRVVSALFELVNAVSNEAMPAIEVACKAAVTGETWCSLTNLTVLSALVKLRASGEVLLKQTSEIWKELSALKAEKPQIWTALSTLANEQVKATENPRIKMMVQIAKEWKSVLTPEAMAALGTLTSTEVESLLQAAVQVTATSRAAGSDTHSGKRQKTF